MVSCTWCFLISAPQIKTRACGLRSAASSSQLFCLYISFFPFKCLNFRHFRTILDTLFNNWKFTFFQMCNATHTDFLFGFLITQISESCTFFGGRLPQGAAIRIQRRSALSEEPPKESNLENNRYGFVFHCGVLYNICVDPSRNYNESRDHLRY